MANNFSVIDRVNLDKICKEVSEYRRYMNVSPNIFMSDETADSIIEEVNNCVVSPAHPIKKRQDGVIGYFEGNKVFIDNTLPFGIVEVR